MNRVSTASLIGCTILPLLIVAACKPSDTAPPPATSKVQAYDMRGIIEKLPTEKSPHELVIRHEPTADMESMAMPFNVDPAVALTGLAVGDKVAFHFEIDLGNGTEHVTKLDKLPSDTVLKIAAPVTAPATMPAMKMPG